MGGGGDNDCRKAGGRVGRGRESMGAGVGTLVVIIVLHPDHHSFPSPPLPSYCHTIPHVVVHCRYAAARWRPHSLSPRCCCASCLVVVGARCAPYVVAVALCAALALVVRVCCCRVVAVLPCAVVVVLGPWWWSW